MQCVAAGVCWWWGWRGGGRGGPAVTRVHDLMWSDSQLVYALPGVGECGMCSDWGVCVCVCDRTRPALPWVHDRVPAQSLHEPGHLQHLHDHAQRGTPTECGRLLQVSSEGQVKYFFIPFRWKCGCHTWIKNNKINSCYFLNSFSPWNTESACPLKCFSPSD